MKVRERRRVNPPKKTQTVVASPRTRHTKSSVAMAPFLGPPGSTTFSLHPPMRTVPDVVAITRGQKRSTHTIIALCTGQHSGGSTAPYRCGHQPHGRRRAAPSTYKETIVCCGNRRMQVSKSLSNKPYKQLLVGHWWPCKGNFRCHTYSTSECFCSREP